MKRIIVGISGASEAEFGHRVLEALHALPVIETHLVIFEGAKGRARSSGGKAMRISPTSRHLQITSTTTTIWVLPSRADPI